MRRHLWDRPTFSSPVPESWVVQMFSIRQSFCSVKRWVRTSRKPLSTQNAAKQVIRHDTGGSIRSITSVGCHILLHLQPQSTYNSSNAALLMLKNCLAIMEATQRICTNSVITPGYMNTILNAGKGLAYARKVCTQGNSSEQIRLRSEVIVAVIVLTSDLSTCDWL